MCHMQEYSKNSLHVNHLKEIHNQLTYTQSTIAKISEQSIKLAPTKTYTVLVWVPNTVKNWCSVQEQWYIKLSITKVVNKFQKTVVYVLVHEQGHMICPLLYGLHAVQYLHKVGGC